MTKNTMPIVSFTENAPGHIKNIFENLLAPGSVAVLKSRETGGAWLYYEGGIYDRQFRQPTEKEKTDYAKIAAGRASENYPTVAKTLISDKDLCYLREVGEVNLTTWTVKFNETVRDGEST